MIITFFNSFFCFFFFFFFNYKKLRIISLNLFYMFLLVASVSLMLASFLLCRSIGFIRIIRR